MIDSILASGLQGIQTGLKNTAENADRLSKAFLPESQVDPVDAIIGMKQGEDQVAASAQVIKVGDQMTKAILDILA